METDLDIQMAHAAAPGARIVLEAARSASLADLLGAAKDAYAKRGALVVSMSFGGSEFPGETGAGADGVFSTGNGRGVSFESRPAYQQGVGGRSRRGIPDVALVADPSTGVTMYDKQAGGFLVVGGTSASDYHDVTTGSAGGSCTAGTGGKWFMTYHLCPSGFEPEARASRVVGMSGMPPFDSTKTLIG